MADFRFDAVTWHVCCGNKYKRHQGQGGSGTARCLRRGPKNQGIGPRSTKTPYQQCDASERCKRVQRFPSRFA